MLFHKNGYLCVEPNLVNVRLSPRSQCLDECIFGKFAVLVVLVGRAAPLESTGNAVCVAELAPRQPHSATEVGTGNFAVLPDAKRRSAGHGTSTAISVTWQCISADDMHPAPLFCQLTCYAADECSSARREH
jgi:hypothetical protein